MPDFAAWGRVLLDAVAPQRCAACGAVANSAICPVCEDAITALPAPRPLPLATGRALAAFPFDGAVREVLHQGKFQGNRRALHRLSVMALDRLCLPGSPEADALVAIPLGRRRRRQRGYNQAEIVATVLASNCGLPLASGLRRERETRPQVSHGGLDRRSNVAGAFAWHGPDVTGARLWLVDDVLTTGATLEAAASVLRQGGARRVDAAVLARVL